MGLAETAFKSEGMLAKLRDYYALAKFRSDPRATIVFALGLAIGKRNSTR